jgi:serine protease Do
MSEVTNKLVGKSARKVAITGGLAAAALGGVLLANFGRAHAALISASPLDDNSVSALTALDHAMESVTAKVEPSVVNVAVTSRGGSEHGTSEENDEEQEQGQGQMPQNLPPGLEQFFGQMLPQGRIPQQQYQHGIGSGVIISPDGYILTNNHVIAGAVSMKVTLHDRRILNAHLVGTDKLTDVAVIKVDARDLPAIAWGDSARLEPGQTVLAFGSPFGYLRDSVTRGIVSAVDRPNPFSGDPRRPGGFIQTDAAINPGNSGGALVNAHGELVGINNMIITDSGSFEGAGFAIPSDMAKAIATQLIAHGSVEHGYLGIGMNDVTPDNAHFFNLQDASGAVVSQVYPDSPASRAGLETGDVITELNGKKVQNANDLQVTVSELAPGAKLDLGILRNGKSMTVATTLAQYHEKGEMASADEAQGDKKGKLGLSVGELTQDARQQLRVPASVHGVAVESVRPASPADEAGLEPGDVIEEVDRKPAGSAEEFANAVHASPDGKDMLLLVWSRGGASFRTIRPSAEQNKG